MKEYGAKKKAGNGGGEAQGPREYASEMPELSEDWTPQAVMNFRPLGCRVSVDRLDSSFRATYAKHRFSKAWRKYGVPGAAVAIIQLMWDVSILLGFETDMPSWVKGLDSISGHGN